MKICMIHGSNRKGNTDRTVELIKKSLDRLDQMEYTDIFLPKDLPHFCSGCFACLRTGERAGENCPHKQYTHPILNALLEADGFVIASPVYAMAETAQIKSLFDHFACIYLAHRPYEEMFDKVVFIATTTAGGGTGYVNRVVDRNMRFWGIKRTVKFQAALHAMNWDEMNADRRSKIERRLEQTTNKFYRLTKKRRQLSSRLSVNLLRFVFRRLILTYADTEPDKIYWKSKGWI